MPDSASTVRLGPLGAGAGGAVRIGVPYPPPPPLRAPDPRTPDRGSVVEELLARPPVVTRYPAGGRARRPSAGAWSAVSAVLAAVGIGAVVLLPQGTGSSARVDGPAPAGVAAAVQPSSPSAPPSAGQVDPAAGPLPLPVSDPVEVRIPALGVTSAVMELGLEKDGAMEVPPGAYPVGWYHGSASPGEQGAAVLAGHVDWEGEPGAFYGLRELVPGDTVAVERADGTVATFAVDRVEEHAKDDFPSEAVYGRIDSAGLRLITCGGAFDEETGEYLDNIVVFASLVAAAG